MAAQARASAVVIGVAPFAFALVIAAVDPSMASAVVRSGAANCFAAGLACECAGLSWIRRLAGAPRDRDHCGHRRRHQLLAMASPPARLAASRSPVRGCRCRRTVRARGCGAGLTWPRRCASSRGTAGPFGHAFADAVAAVDDGARGSHVLVDLPARG